MHPSVKLLLNTTRIDLFIYFYFEWCLLKKMYGFLCWCTLPGFYCEGRVAELPVVDWLFHAAWCLELHHNMEEKKQVAPLTRAARPSAPNREFCTDMCESSMLYYNCDLLCGLSVTSFVFRDVSFYFCWTCLTIIVWLQMEIYICVNSRVVFDIRFK